MNGIKANDLVDSIFGRLTVVGFVGSSNGHRFWKCLCSCGNFKVVSTNRLRNGNVKSCGCLHRESASRQGKANTTHGLRHSREYKSWCSMKRRCLTPSCHAFKDYGQRGIKVCDRWLNFENFLADMGTRPSGTSLGRINNDGDYCPENCRWETRKQQNSNSRNNHPVTLNGETMLLSDWAERIGITKSGLLYRINKGWPSDRILLPKL